MKKFSRVKGVSERRRLPRLGKIRLGFKKVTKSGKEYPAEADYFICPPEVQKVYGEKPKELEIVFPVEDPEVFFPQSYKAYGLDQRLKCKGDGEVAIRVNQETGELEERDCPCEWLEEGKCAIRGHLLVILPKVSMGGTYQIDTGSYNNIVAINSYIDYLRALVGRVSLIPLVLRRVEQVVQAPDGKARKHYLLQLELPADFETIVKMRKEKEFVPVPQFELEPPKEEGEEPDTPIELVEEEIVEATKEESETSQNEEDLTEKAIELMDKLGWSEKKKQAVIKGIKTEKDLESIINYLQERLKEEKNE